MSTLAGSVVVREGLTCADSLLLQPMQFLPAFDGALQQLIANIHEPTRHDIQGKECESHGLSLQGLRLTLDSSSPHRSAWIVWATAL